MKGGRLNIPPPCSISHKYFIWRLMSILFFSNCLPWKSLSQLLASRKPSLGEEPTPTKRGKKRLYRVGHLSKLNRKLLPKTYQKLMAFALNIQKYPTYNAVRISTNVHNVKIMIQWYTKYLLPIDLCWYVSKAGSLTIPNDSSTITPQVDPSLAHLSWNLTSQLNTCSKLVGKSTISENWIGGLLQSSNARVNTWCRLGYYWYKILAFF